MPSIKIKVVEVPKANERSNCDFAIGEQQNPPLLRFVGQSK